MLSHHAMVLNYSACIVRDIRVHQQSYPQNGFVDKLVGKAILSCVCVALKTINCATFKLIKH